MFSASTTRVTMAAAFQISGAESAMVGRGGSVRTEDGDRLEADWRWLKASKLHSLNN